MPYSHDSHPTIVINILGTSAGARSATAAALFEAVKKEGFSCDLVGLGGSYSMLLATKFFGKVDVVVGDGLRLDSVGLSALRAVEDQILYLSVWIESENPDDKKLMEAASHGREIISVNGTVAGNVETILNFFAHPVGGTASDMGTPGATPVAEARTQNLAVDETEDERKARHEADRDAYDFMLSRG